MKSRKGFTLVELIGVIILIGLIALIAIPSVDYVIKKTEDNAYEATVKTLMDGLRNWTTDNKELVYEDGTEILLTLTDLKEQGYVDFDIRNPKTKLCLANNMQFKITRVKSEEKDKYEFEIMGNELLDGTLKDCEAVSKTPSIYLLGDNPQKIEITNNIALGYEAYDPGVVAKSTTGEDLTHSVVKTNDVKLNILSKNYHAKYTIIENGISKTVTRKVHVVDTTAPELHVPEDLEIELGETLNLLEGVTATDNSGETPKIKTSSNVNFNKEGEYKVTYIATDSSGNSVSKDRVIKVTKPYYILKKSGYPGKDIHSNAYKDKIVTITFKHGSEVPADAVVTWDMSEAQDNSIIGYLVPDSEAPEYYNAYIGSDGYIRVNPDSHYWFYMMQNLMEINFDNYDTTNLRSMSYMFASARSLEKLDISNFDTSQVTSMTATFSGVPAATLDISEWDTSSVTSMYEMFYGAKATNLDVSNFDTSNVKSMVRMFKYTNVINLDVSNFNTSNVTNMASMFESSQVASLDLSNFDTSQVTDMSYMFSDSKLTILDVSEFDTSNVTNMASMFSNLKATTLDVSNFDTSNVIDMNWMFRGTNAEVLDVSNFDTSKVTNMRSMFASAKANVIDVSNFNTSNVTNMSWMFENVKDPNLDVSGFNTSKVTDMNSMFRTLKATTLDLSSFDTSNVIDMSSMFYDANILTLDLRNFNTSKVTNMRFMFYQSDATIIDVSSFDTSNVIDMDNMFNCVKVRNLDLSNFNTSKVTDMYSMFYGASVASLNLSNFDTRNVTSMSMMFTSTYNLMSLDLSSFNTSKVTSMFAMFSHTKFSELDLSNFDLSNVSDVKMMFNGTSNLVSIKTPYNIPTGLDLDRITSYGFTGSDGNTYAAGTFPTGNAASITLTR